MSCFGRGTVVWFTVTNRSMVRSFHNVASWLHKKVCRKYYYGMKFSFRRLNELLVFSLFLVEVLYSKRQKANAISF